MPAGARDAHKPLPEHVRLAVPAAITEGVKEILNGNMAWMTIFAQITDLEIRVLFNDLV